MGRIVIHRRDVVLLSGLLQHLRGDNSRVYCRLMLDTVVPLPGLCSRVVLLAVGLAVIPGIRTAGVQTDQAAAHIEPEPVLVAAQFSGAADIDGGITLRLLRRGIHIAPIRPCQHTSRIRWIGRHGLARIFAAPAALQRQDNGAAIWKQLLHRLLNVCGSGGPGAGLPASSPVGQVVLAHPVGEADGLGLAAVPLQGGVRQKGPLHKIAQGPVGVQVGPGTAGAARLVGLCLALGVKLLSGQIGIGQDKVPLSLVVVPPLHAPDAPFALGHGLGEDDGIGACGALVKFRAVGGSVGVVGHIPVNAGIAEVVHQHGGVVRLRRLRGGRAGAGRLSGGGLLRGLLGLGAGEGAPHRHRHNDQGCRQHSHRPLGLLCNEGNPLPQTSGSRGHGGGRPQQLGRVRAGGHQGQQGAAVGRPLLLPQQLDGPLVTGELTVPPGQGRRQPNQRVEPVEGQAEAPHQGPELVALAAVGQLMGQNVL